MLADLRERGSLEQDAAKGRRSVRRKLVMPFLRSTARLDPDESTGRRRRRSAVTRGLAVLVVAGGGALAATSPAWAAGSSGRLGGFNRTAVPARANPPASIQPTAAFRANCFTTGNTYQCNIAALAAIDQGLAAEHLSPMVLPASVAQFSRWGVLRQLRVVANLERAKRGLPTLTDSRALDGRAQAGATQGTDPTGPPGYAWGSVIAWGYATPLAADFAWMYDDGPGSSNINCTSPGAAGCWGHRDNILSPWPGQQGAGDYASHGRAQLTELFVEAY